MGYSQKEIPVKMPLETMKGTRRTKNVIHMLCAHAEFLTADQMRKAQSKVLAENVYKASENQKLKPPVIAIAVIVTVIALCLSGF